MAFVSRNPKAILNPETAENCVNVEPKNLQAGNEFIGFYKNCYIETEYTNKCYVFKSKDDGRDYLFYGTKALHTEMAYYSQGDLVSIIYQGEKVAKTGKFAGKSFHAWKVTADDSWIPPAEFIAQLQHEVQTRRVEVQNILGTRQAPSNFQQSSFASQAHSVPLTQALTMPGFVQSPPKKSINPFG